MNRRPNLSTRRVAGAAFALALGVGSVTSAQAAFPTQLPFMCFNTAHTFHQTFGPNSFFLDENQQGPTGFHENPPTSKPTVTFALRQGTAGIPGHTVYYVITDTTRPTPRRRTRSPRVTSGGPTTCAAGRSTPRTRTGGGPPGGRRNSRCAWSRR